MARSQAPEIRSAGRTAFLLTLALAAPIAAQDDRPAQPTGVELFARPPETPLELWDAVDYLVRIGRPDQAAPFLDRFLAANPDDETLLIIRERYGLGSILTLEDFPPTAGKGRGLIDRLAAASKRNVRNAERLDQLAALLLKSPAERALAIQDLRKSGSYAVAPIVQVIAASGADPGDRAILVDALGRLDRRALPALAAILDSPDAPLAADAARALGQVGDPRAVPFLVAQTLNADEGREAVRDAATAAIARLGGARRPTTTPAKQLVAEAKRYLSGAYRFPEGPVEVWGWDESAGVPVPTAMTAKEATAVLGLKFAAAALAAAPDDPDAKVVDLALEIDRVTADAGPGAFFAPAAAEVHARALQADPTVLGGVLDLALADNLPDVATVAATLLGQVVRDRKLDLSAAPSLSRALNAPDRRTQFAAARAIAESDPRQPFAGSSEVVPTLARFLAPYPAHRAVVIDGNLARGNVLASSLKQLGFEPEVATKGRDGFEAAARTADVELIFIEPTAHLGAWGLRDTMANLRADARTAGIPVLIDADDPDIEFRVERFITELPLVEFLTVPPAAADLGRQLGRIAARLDLHPLADDEQRAFADAAADQLAAIASRRSGPLFEHLDAAEPALRDALHNRALAPAASAALGELPSIDAQRDLAEQVLDPVRPAPQRQAASARLVASIRRFGPLLSADQEDRLVAALDQPVHRPLAAELAQVIDALRPAASRPRGTP